LKAQVRFRIAQGNRMDHKYKAKQDSKN